MGRGVRKLPAAIGRALCVGAEHRGSGEVRCVGWGHGGGIPTAQHWGDGWVHTSLASPAPTLLPLCAFVGPAVTLCAQRLWEIPGVGGEGRGVQPTWCPTEVCKQSQTAPNLPFFLGGGVQTVPSSRTHLRDEFCIPSPGGAAYSGEGGDKGGENRLCSPPPGAAPGAAAMV